MLLTSHSERPEQRRMLEDADGDEVMVGEIQASEEVERPWSVVSATGLDDWQHREYAAKLKELQPQNDVLSTHEVPSSEVVNEEVVKNTWGLQRTR